MAITVDDQAAKECIAFLVDRLGLSVNPNHLVSLDVRFALGEAVVVKMEMYAEPKSGNS